MFPWLSSESRMVEPIMEAAGIEPAQDSPGLSDALGYHLAGFIDGEGCFNIRRGSRKKAAYQCAFAIGLRADDHAFLQEIRDACGQIGGIYRVVQKPSEKHPRKTRPQYVWHVASKQGCVALVEILERYPLRSKKRRDFDIWRQAVSAWFEQDFAQMGRLAEALKATREYREGPLADGHPMRKATWLFATFTTELRWGHTPDNAILGRFKWGSRLYKPLHDHERPRVDGLHSWTPPEFRDVLIDMARSAMPEPSLVAAKQKKGQVTCEP